MLFSKQIVKEYTANELTKRVDFKVKPMLGNAWGFDLQVLCRSHFKADDYSTVIKEVIARVEEWKKGKKSYSLSLVAVNGTAVIPFASIYGLNLPTEADATTAENEAEI